MNQKEFMEMPLLQRIEFVNELLSKEKEEPLKKVAEAIGMSYSTFTKELRSGGFCYNISKRQYEKTMSVSEYRQLQASSGSKEEPEAALQFLIENFAELKKLLNQQEIELILDPRVYDPYAKTVGKSIKVNEIIYNEFTQLCETSFPHYRLRDLISHCLLSFNKAHKKTLSDT